MPLIHGYTPKSIEENVAHEMRRGKPQAQAVAISFEEARKAWRHAHPKGPYPAHLRGMRERHLNQAKKIQAGMLHDYRTGAALRRATKTETRQGIRQAKRDGGAGVFIVNDRPVYVEGGGYG